MARVTPLTIITGYLGSGKTTLLRHILQSSRKRIAVVMNEFGEIDIDAKVIRGKNVDIAELAGGCVCCSLTGEFEQAIREILVRAKPDWIVLETTGAAEPDAILLSLEGLPEVRLDAVVTVVDADAMVRFPSLGHIGTIQIQMADLLLINKADLVTSAQLAAVTRKVHELNPRALAFPVERCAVQPEVLFGVEAARKPVKRKNHQEKGIDHFSLSSDQLLDRRKFQAFLAGLPAQVYRAKGFVRFPEGSFLFNVVAGRVSLEEFPAERTEMVFLGQGIAKLRSALLLKLGRAVITGEPTQKSQPPDRR